MVALFLACLTIVIPLAIALIPSLAILLWIMKQVHGEPEPQDETPAEDVDVYPLEEPEKWP